MALSIVIASCLHCSTVGSYVANGHAHLAFIRCNEMQFFVLPFVDPYFKLCNKMLIKLASETELCEFDPCITVYEFSFVQTTDGFVACTKVICKVVYLTVKPLIKANESTLKTSETNFSTLICS